MSDLGNKAIMARNIKYYMNKKGVNQKEVCEALHYKETTFSGWVTATTYPRINRIEELANYFGIEKADLIEDKTRKHGFKIPVLGRVVAGIPIEAITDILDYEEITPELASTGDFFALQIKGDSMTPRICEGDVVIIRKQQSVDSGSLAIVLINGEEATIKQVIIRSDGIMLQAFNPAVYPTHFYTCADIKKLPVVILGKVVELRGKFL